MADAPIARINLQTEELRSGGGVSESTLSRMGQAVNFINQRQHSEKVFVLNGAYNKGTVPYYAVDGLLVFEYNAEIVGLWAHHHIGGTGGTTEMNVRWSADPTSTAGYTTKFQSIFSTTPKITASAPDYAWIGIGDTVTGMTAPVLSKTTFDAGDALSIDLVSAMAGAAVLTCGIIIHYRPR